MSHTARIHLRRGSHVLTSGLCPVSPASHAHDACLHLVVRCRRSLCSLLPLKVYTRCESHQLTLALHHQASAADPPQNLGALRRDG